MQLDEWLEKTGHTRKWLASEIGVSKRRIDTLLFGALPRLKEAMDIEAVTLRKVTLKDWVKK